jgi:EmrB/QacA subfamily drug resistance transporter
MTTDQPRATSAQYWVLALASLGAFMVALDALVVTTALGTIRVDLGASVAQLEWTVNAFTLSFAVLLMTGATLGDRLGRKRVFTVGLGVFTAASAGCALSPDAGWLIAGRAIQGIGAALVTPVAVAMVSAAVPPRRRGWALGIFSSAIGLAVLSGPVVGGGITEGIAWQWVFWLNVPIGLAAITLVLVRIEESFGPRVGLDVVGIGLVSAASLGLVWGLVRANSVGWSSVEVPATLAVGAVLTAGFVVWERRAAQPMLPVQLFRSRAFSAGNAVSFLLFASNLSLTFFFAQFHQIALGQSPLQAGLRLLPWTAPLVVGAPRVGALVDRVGERALVVGGLLIQAAGTAWLAAVASPHVAYAALVVPMIVIGIGTTLAMPACQKAVVGAVAPSDIGRASGTFTTMRWFGGVFGIAIAVAVFAEAGGYGSPGAFSDGFVAAAGVSAGLALLGAIAGTGLGHARAALVTVPTPTTAKPALDADGAG